MKKIIFVIVLISVFYCIKAQNIQPDSLEFQKDEYFYQPQYMENINVANLWYIQPIKEVTRYNIIMFSLLYGMIAIERGNTEILMYTYIGAPVGATLTGVFIGLIKAVYYNKIYSELTQSFRKPKFFIENEISLNANTSFSAKLVYNNKTLFFNEISLKYGGTEYDGIEYDNSGISSVQVEITDYILEDNSLNLFYALSSGYSSVVFKSFQGHSLLEKTEYDFCGSLQVGIKVNLIDFAYLKFSTSYLYSPNLDKIISKHQNIDESIKYNFSIAVGSDLF